MDNFGNCEFVRAHFACCLNNETCLSFLICVILLTRIKAWGESSTNCLHDPWLVLRMTFVLIVTDDDLWSPSIWGSHSPLHRFDRNVAVTPWWKHVQSISVLNCMCRVNKQAGCNAWIEVLTAVLLNQLAWPEFLVYMFLLKCGKHVAGNRWNR
jgi:hypothetical protein